MGTQPTSIAIISDFVFYYYPTRLLAGIQSVLKQRGITSTIYQGGELRSEGHLYRKANDIYQLIRREQHQGLILFSQTLSRKDTSDELLQFIEPFADLPMVSIGRSIPGVPSVSIDNTPGMQALMEHLIKERDHRNFAFVRGVVGNLDSDEREWIFKDALAKHQLPFHPGLILNGDYDPQHAYAEVTRFLSSGAQVDVIVSANDEMTEGITRALRERNLRIPEDVAVVGFDDSDDFRSAVPPLTTVRQPFFEQGRAAAEALLALIDHGSTPLEVRLDTQLIIRQSCGTSSRTALKPQHVAPSLDTQGWSHAPREQQQVFESLYQATLDPSKRAEFLLFWKNSITTSLQAHSDVNSWFDILQSVREKLRPTLSGDTRADFDDLHASALSMLYSALKGTLTSRRARESSRAYLISQMSAAPTFEELLKGVDEYLTHYGMQSFALVFYEPFGPTPANAARVVLARGMPSPPAVGMFNPRGMLPDVMRAELARRNLMVAPLYTYDVHYGYVVYERPNQVYFDDETPLRTVINALAHFNERTAVKQYAQKLEHHSDILEQEVKARTRQLEDEILEHQMLARRLDHQANHDPLTGLPNRTFFTERLAYAIRQAEVSGYFTSLLFVDLDDFKGINDTLGHDVGDKVLITVAQRLQGCVRQEDLVARVGGDEFTVILPLSGVGEATAVAQRILSAFAVPFEVGNRQFYLGASIGISVSQEAGLNAGTLQRHADMAMYRAKHRKTGYEVFEPDMNRRTLERLQLASDLRRAVERQELELHYQPQVRLRDGELIGVEALLRWRHPERGMISPAQFIPLAEETGLIVPLGAWVLQEACRQGVEWANQGHASFRIAVNVSALQFERDDFVSTVSASLASTGFASERLELELTESIVMRDVRETTIRMEHLRQLGVSIAVDDFGTGYSSLSYLQRLPLNVLKIDRSFVQNLRDAENALPVVKAIVGLANHLGLSTLAEGVETDSELQLLLDVGCDFAQGYHFARPLPPGEILAFLEQQARKMIERHH
ncbi:EAL domain-containing protein [Deinococcus peraridilitoris]|uniref:Diguanylate cyclase (GGDEF) domain-containing protein n=1 Tax=Deinococcus peraridilitoris (strain DSM 19664 / LMG 22246 / CIP 109416 / KR-200) TaxID=937777 RepID=L0A600_DEIPD|nr:EAL domain-containing protein [Deinococcus peraridilitoris]AFZ69276.1 diguanylate cyclase (GGDEF) domain-containing protein [Deinococcus peraridilitoris DSM 19664]